MTDDREISAPRDAHALLPIVYDELRRVAAARLKKLPPGQTLQPTALVHEAYAELVRRGDPGWNGKGHFFAAAAHAMHDLLVDQARRKGAAKRGAGEVPVAIDESAVFAALDAKQEDLVAVSAAMQRLADRHPRQAEVARLKVFAGASEAEIAEMTDVNVRTVERDWRFARAFLLRELSR
jgi:RNA polymerase sigma factor (TIGR02999 family)